jgi:2-aminoethylphosphonate transport system permease protein
VTWAIFAIVFLVIFGLPLLTLLLASFSGQWNGILPSQFSVANFSRVLAGSSASNLWISLVTGLIASFIALVIGTWAALVIRGMRSQPRRVFDALFLMPLAVPSVSVGLGLLVAFSHPPLALNGTLILVLFAHVVLVTAFAFNNVSAGVAQLPQDQEQIAASLGASPPYVLFRVTLPLLIPQLIAAASLAFALSMGELAATIMIYPPNWVTMPIGIFGLTDRGAIFGAAAMAVLLVAITFCTLIGMSRIRTRASYR